ncbi:MAG: ADP-ribosylglycohydrolase family protein [Oscillospiraceae bacterium]|nr:ADP-ribosylglycohydrolase family protein [Oscillospiraceae bacterium]
MLDHVSRFIGAFTGLAIGDAFGYPCRDMTFEQICERFEKKGCLRLAVSGKTNTALFTDATQMSLFTTDGILWATLSQGDEGVNYTEYVFYAYQMWLYTQTKTVAGEEYTWLFDMNQNPYRSKLIKTKGLYRKAFSEPINVEILSRMRNLSYGKITKPQNTLDDTGAIKRVMPAGLFFNYDTELAFRAGADFAAITHGSPSSYLSAGCYCAIIAELINNKSIDDATVAAIEILQTYKGHEELLETLQKAQSYLNDPEVPPLVAISHIGTENKAVHAFAVALFAATLFEDSFENAIRLATNHDGQSDVCGALCGGILGAYHGAHFVSPKWLKKLSYLRLIEDIAISLAENSYFRDENDTDDSDNFDGVPPSENASNSKESKGLAGLKNKFKNKIKGETEPISDSEPELEIGNDLGSSSE